MLKFLLPYYVTFFLAAFVLPSWRLWKVSGINALVLPHDDSPYGLIGRWFKALMVAVFMLVTALAMGSDPALFGVFKWAQYEPLEIAGFFLLGTSAMLIVIAQLYMGRSWRIGIDEGATPIIVTNGLFAVSRNPIFLGMRVNMFGLFLVFPSGVTLTIFLLEEALIAIQVRLEEQYLVQSLGKEYRNYAKSVRRWI